MAVPKRRMSRSNTRNRRSQWKAKLPESLCLPSRLRGFDSRHPLGDRTGPLPALRWRSGPFLTGYSAAW